MQIKNVASSEITICGRTYDEYIEMIKAFHGHIAPGRLRTALWLYERNFCPLFCLSWVQKYQSLKPLLTIVISYPER